MAKYFAIMPDTCCDLSKKFQEEYDIEVLLGHYTTPDGKEHVSFHEWGEIDRDQFYKDLKKNPEYVIRDKEGAEIFTFPEETEVSLDRFRDEGATKVFSHRPSKMIFLRVSKKVWVHFIQI